MRFFLDAQIVIDHLRGDPLAFDALIHPAIRGHQFWSSTLVRAEVLSAMRDEDEPYTKTLLSEIRWLSVTPSIADRAGWIARRGSPRRRHLSVVESIIAASADSIAAPLITKRPERYPGVETARRVFR